MIRGSEAFHDQRRFWSSEIRRAFASPMRAVSQGLQSELSQPEEVRIEREVTLRRMHVVRR